MSPWTHVSSKLTGTDGILRDDFSYLPSVVCEQPACWELGRKEGRLEGGGGEQKEGHTTMLSLARQPLQNQEQMGRRFPNPSFGSDCPGKKVFQLPGG